MVQREDLVLLAGPIDVDPDRGRSESEGQKTGGKERREKDARTVGEIAQPALHSPPRDRPSDHIGDDHELREIPRQQADDIGDRRPQDHK